MKPPSRARPLRALFVANDGLGAGHAARALAVASALPAEARSQGLEASVLLATTSEASSLLDAIGVATLRLPSIGACSRAGLSAPAYRALAEAALAGAAEGFAPDLVVVDTFPEGPHRELCRLLDAAPRRALVRRSVRADRANEPELRAGLERYDRVVVPGDPGPCPAPPHARSHEQVPPITLGEGAKALPRAEARGRLGVSERQRVILIAAGGGGDEGARRWATAAARAALGLGQVPVVAAGPLGPLPELPRGALVLREAPLAPWLPAFDGAVSPAGYNTAHELARARVPAVLLARERPFDDQRARAERFERAGHAVFVEGGEGEPSAAGEERLSLALARLAGLSPPGLEPGGARAAARSLLSLVTGGRR